MKFWKMATAALLVGALAATTACSLGTNAPQQEEERVLRIASSWGLSSTDDYLRTQWTELFEFANPHITIELVPTLPGNYYELPMESRRSSMELLQEAMEGDNPPDVILMGYEHISQLTESNLLAPLDPFVQRDQLDLSLYVPSVIEGIKEQGGGQLYAMAPSFSSQALVYNMDLFDETGVPYPRDGMTWPELFDIAAQLSNPEQKRYGFSFSSYAGNDLFWDMNNYVLPLGLQLADPETGELLVDSDQWENVWRTFADISNREIVPPSGYDPETGMPRGFDPNERQGPFSYDLFLSGKVAMTLISNGQINEIIQANENGDRIEGFTPFRWELVSVPSHPEAPGVGGSMSLDGLMGINANAQNQEDAWELIMFINSYDWARLKSRSMWNMSTYQEFIAPKPGYDYNVAAFTQVKPALSMFNDQLYQKFPNFWEIQSIGVTKLQDVIDGKKEARQALKEWKAEGDVALQRMMENMPQGAGSVE